MVAADIPVVDDVELVILRIAERVVEIEEYPLTDQAVERISAEFGLLSVSVAVGNVHGRF